MKNQLGLSLIEVILAAALFMIFASGAVVVVLNGYNANRLGVETTIATQFASEGIEAVISIKNQSFANLVDSAGTGIVRNGSSVWAFSGSNNILDKYSRVITITDVQRDSSGNIVASGGSVDSNTKKITSTVSWNFTTSRPETFILTKYLTAWKNKKGGLLLYGDGGTTTDAVKYQIFDANTNTWGAVTPAFDVDGATTNKALRIVKLYTSSTRSEKIALSRHYNGSAQFIYATVWNGSSWGTPTQLSTWTASTFLDVQNFDGTYLNDGTFMVVYSDNTIIPKYRIWNGSSWSAQNSLTTLGINQIPNYIVTRVRPGTNEVMAAFFTQGSAPNQGNTITQYWSGSAWSAITSHATAAPVNTERLVDFAWSTNNLLIGGLIFTDNGADKSIDIKIWTANGSGSGVWSAIANTTNQSNNIGALAIMARSGANEFDACDKDSLNPPRIICYKSDFTPNWTNPINQTIVSGTDNGIQKSFDIGFKTLTGDLAIIVYSDNTTVPKYKNYTASTATWDVAATTISTTGYSPGVFKSARIIPQDQGDDMVVLMADAKLNLYSVFWNGSGNTMYTTPASLITTQHGVSGSTTTDFWYDFAWDKY